MRSADRTRREAVRSGSIAAGAVLATATAPVLLRVADALADDGDDRAIIESAIAAEQTAAVAYGAAAGSSLLTKPLVDVAMLFHDQATAHAMALGRELQALGGKVPRPPRAEDVKGLAAVRTEAEFLEFAIGIENSAVRAYLEALQGLQTPALLETAARIMASAGQHLVVLRQALSPEPTDWVPDAFETGTSPQPA
jgi:hypothetical protein